MDGKLAGKYMHLLLGMDRESLGWDMNQTWTLPYIQLFPNSTCGYVYSSETKTIPYMNNFQDEYIEDMKEQIKI